VTRDPPEHDQAPAAIQDPSVELDEDIEVTEGSDLIVLSEPPASPAAAPAPEVSELIVIIEPPEPPEPLLTTSTPPEPQTDADDLETLFDDPQQLRTELLALRAANHELVRINERLATAVEQRTADMLAARDRQARFISDVNRQVRGPLDAIIGYSELLTEDLTSLELHDLAHDVEKIRGAGESLLDLLGELIERRRLDGG
jgi:signal transduction histidine kinase